MNGRPRLHPHRLGDLPRAVRVPRFVRETLRTGIVHLGLGAFARAHLLACHDDALEAPGAAPRDWGVTGVSLRHAEVRDALAPQRGLYSLALRDGHGTALRVIGSLREVLVAPEGPGAVLDLIAAPATRIVSLTVTEKGYGHDPAGTGSGALRFDHPELAHDLAHPEAPRSTLGFLVHGLARRRADGGAPVALLSLDNLPSNGDTLRRLVLALAERVSSGLARWIERECSFPNSMVDRIVPRATDADRAAAAAALGCDDAAAVAAEPYFAWALEDRFAAGRPDWAAGGARLVERAAPWERLKLRMLNGAHSTIAYAGVLAGWPTVDAAMRQPPLARFVAALMREEIAPTLAEALPGVDLGGYAGELLARFDNPALAHRTAQIAMDGSHKLPQRLLGTVRDRLAAGAPLPRLALAVALWLTHLRRFDEAGRAFAVDDPLAPALAELWHRAAAADDDDRARAETFAAFAPVFGDLAGEPRWIDALAVALKSLRTRGVAAALEAAA